MHMCTCASSLTEHTIAAALPESAPLPPLSVGLMVAKALYEGILVNLALAPFFCGRLQGRTPMFDDLATLDPALHRSLMQVGSVVRDGGCERWWWWCGGG